MYNARSTFTQNVWIYIRWNINWSYVISSLSFTSDKMRQRWNKQRRTENNNTLQFFSNPKTNNLNSLFENRHFSISKMKDGSAKILQSSPWLLNSWIVFGLFLRFYANATLPLGEVYEVYWHVATERWTGLGRDYFQRYFSLFFSVYRGDRVALWSEERCSRFDTFFSWKD